MDLINFLFDSKLLLKNRNRNRNQNSLVFLYLNRNRNSFRFPSLLPTSIPSTLLLTEIVIVDCHFSSSILKSSLYYGSRHHVPSIFDALDSLSPCSNRMFYLLPVDICKYIYPVNVRFKKINKNSIC
jgi:hypothetical protein